MSSNDFFSLVEEYKKKKKKGITTTTSVRDEEESGEFWDLVDQYRGKDNIAPVSSQSIIKNAVMEEIAPVSMAQKILGSGMDDETMLSSFSLAEFRAAKDEVSDRGDQVRLQSLFNQKLISNNEEILSKTKMDGKEHSVLEEMNLLAKMDSGDEKDERKSAVLKKMEELGLSTDDYAMYAGDSNFSWENFGNWAGNAAMSGLASFNKGITSTVDLILGNPLKALGWENNPVSEIADYYSDIYDSYKFKTDLYAQKLGGGKGYDFANSAIEGTMGAVPNAILALMTAGISMAGTAATTTSSLTTQAAYQSGNILTKAGLTTEAMMKNPQYWLSFARTYGTDYEEAKSMGASDTAAVLGATLTSLVNAGIEIGTDGLSGIQGLPQEIAEEGGSKLLKWAISNVEEGGEEGLQKFVNEVVAKTMYNHDLDILNPKEYLEEMAIGTISGAALGGGQIALQGASNAVGSAVQNYQDHQLTENEQKVVDKVVEDRIAEKEKDGTKLTKKEKSEIHEEVFQQMKKGYISIETIEEGLGDRSSYDALEKEAKEFDTLYNTATGQLSKAQQNRLAELEAKNNENPYKDALAKSKEQYSKGVFDMVKGDRLSESYREKDRVYQDFQADFDKYKGTKHEEAARKTLESAMKAGANNTNRVHDLVDMAAQISADTGRTFSFKSGEQIKNDFVERQTKVIAEMEKIPAAKRTAEQSKKLADLKDLLAKVQSGETVVNGDITADGIVLNLDSDKPLNRTVGHEVTHSLENAKSYKELKDSLYAYAKSKGIDIDSELNTRKLMYEGVTDADPEAELIADLVGDFLFTDSEYVRKLSTENQNVFQKFWDKIKYLCKVATAGSQEARELARVEKAFADAYREGGKAKGETQYALSDDFPNDAELVAKEYFGTTEKWSETGWLLRDGTQLDFSGRHWERDPENEIDLGESYYSGKRNMEHYEIAEAFPELREYSKMEYRGEHLYRFQNRGNIRIVGKGIVGIEKMPTEEQFEKLRSYFGENIDRVITVGIGKRGLTYPEGTKPSVIIEGIRDYFSRNRRNQSDLMQFHAKYSLSDSDGKQLTKEQQDYFKDSKMRDENGNLKVMYHGSKHAGFHVFDAQMSDDDISFFFTDSNEVASSYSRSKEVYEARTFHTAKDMNKFLAEIGYDDYEVVKSGGKYTLYYDVDEAVATSDNLKDLYNEFCDYAGVGEGKANYKVYLNLKNPLVVDAEGRNWDNISTEFYPELYEQWKNDYFTEEEKAALIDLAGWEDYSTFKSEVERAIRGANKSTADEYTKAISSAFWKHSDVSSLFSMASDNFSDEVLKAEAVKQMDTREYAQKAKAEGYDGVIFKNLVDIGEYGRGRTPSTVAIAFDSNQIKSTANAQPTTDPDIRYSMSSMANTFFGDENMTAEQFKKADYRQTQGYKDYVDQCLNNYRQTRADFDEATARKSIEDSIEGIVKVAIAAKQAGYDIYDDATKRSKTDSKNRLLFSSLEPNSDYFTSNDISTICDKRKNFAEIYDDIVRAEEAKGVPKGKRFFDNVDNYFAIHKIMADKGLTTPCRQCYVESMRKNLAPMANAFLRLVQETNPDNTANDQLYHQKGKQKGEEKTSNAATREFVLSELIAHPEYNMSVNDLTVETLTTADGLAQLKLQAPTIYEAFNSFYGQSKPKMPKGATPFRFGELTALLTDEKGKIKKSVLDKINSTGGFRLQSYSDFQIQNYTDVLQVLFEAGTLGLKGHAYTKVPAFLDATEGTNLKRNISIFMYKDGGQWKLDKNDSFPYDLEEIYDLVKADESGNTGIIAVSQNADMSAWIMANDYVGYGIPFHKSGLKMGTVRDTEVKTEDGRVIKGYSGTIDHTKQQTEVWAKAGDGHKAETKVKKGINIYSFWDFDNKSNLSKNELIEKNVKAYIDQCEMAGYLPKFRAYVMNNGKVLNDVLKYSKELGFVGEDATIEDISFQYKGYTIPYGYYKFLGDFGMFTPDGKASAQKTLSLENYDFDKAVKFFSDSETLRRNEILQQFANGEERQRYRDSDLTAGELQDIVKQKRREVAESVVGDIAPSMSLSSGGDQFAPTSSFDISGKDFRVKDPTQETVSEMESVPAVEKATSHVLYNGRDGENGWGKVYTTAQEALNDAVQSLKPGLWDAISEEIGNSVDVKNANTPMTDALIAVQEDVRQSTITPMQGAQLLSDAYGYGGAAALRGLYNPKTGNLYNRYLEKAKQYETVTPATEETDLFPDDLAPMEDSADRLASLDDADAPPEVEAPYYESEPVSVDNPFADRDMHDVGNRKVKAYMYENPEVKPFFQDAALGMLSDLRDGTKGERWYNGDVYYRTNGEKGFFGTKRNTTDDIAELLDQWHYTYDQIEKGLNAIIEDNGAENNAVSKRIEFMLNDRLLNGYKGVDGRPYPPDQDYINLLNEKQITEYSDEAFDSFMATADQYAPVEIGDSADQTDGYNNRVATLRKSLSGMKRNHRKKVENYSIGMYTRNGSDSITISIQQPNGEIIKEIIDGGKYWTNSQLHNQIAEMIAEAEGYTPQTATASTDSEDVAPVTEMETATDDIAPVAEEYEAIRPKRERSTEPKMVRADAKGKERKWVGTSTGSDAVDGKVLPEDLDQELIHYQPISNKKTLGNANSKLDSMGYETAVAYMSSQFASNKVSLDDIALGERLIQEAVKRGDTKTAGDLIMDISILGTELGQKVQALSIIKRLTPEGQLRMLQRVVDRGKTKGDKAFEGVEITQEMIDYILKTYGEDGTYNQAELNKRVEDVKQQIADKMKVSAMDYINEWRYLSMLGNPKTHIRNMVSNAAMWATRQAKNAVARTIEDIAPIKKRTKTWKRASDDVKAYADQVTAEEYAGESDSKYSEFGSIKAKRRIFKTDVANRIAKFNSDALSGEDTFFSKPAFREAFTEYLTANGIRTKADIENNSKLIAEAKQYAMNQAKEATFQQDSYIASKISEVERRNPLLGVAVGSVMPFKKTPINIAKTAAAYSPLGLARNIYDALQVNKGNMEASEAIDHLAQTLTGTALTLLGFAWARAGFLNGAGDDDKEGEYDYQLGEQSYSFNFNGSTFSLSWLSPVAMPLFVGANAYEQFVAKEDWNWNVVTEALAQTLDPLSEMSFLSSLADVLSSYDSGMAAFGGMIESASQSYITSLVPTLSSQIAQVTDDTKRSTKVAANSGWDFGEETWNKIKYKIPGLRQTLEASTDIWGNEVKQADNVLTRAFESFLAPYARREDIATEVDEEIKALYRETGDTGLIPSVPYNYINYDGEKYEMSAEEFTEFKKAYGQTAFDLMEELFATKTYQNAASETRADMVNKVYDYARDEARRAYFADQGVEFTNATKDGKEYYKPNAIKSAIAADMPVDEYVFSRDYPEKYSFFQENGISYEDYASADEEGKRAYTWASENPGKYEMSKAISDDFLTYWQYKTELGDLEGDKDANGKTISGSKKNKVIAYINDMDLDYGQKIILFKSEYSSDDTYNYDIIEYLNGRDDISYRQMETILKVLGFNVDAQGNITWD